MTAQLQPGKLVTLRGREWVVLPSEDPDNLLIVKPLGGSDRQKRNHRHLSASRHQR